MDRRTLLAMVLFLVLFLVWSKVMDRYRPEPAPAGPDTAAVVETDAGAKAAGPAGLAAAAAPDSAAAALTAAVAGTFAAPGDAVYELGNDLFTLRIAEAGGAIVGCKLRDYRNGDGGQVELVPPAGALDEAPAGDVLVHEGGELDLTAAPFLPVGEAGFALAAGAAPRELVLEAAGAGGLVVRKIFTLKPGTYVVDVRYEVPSGGPVLRGARFAWRRGIAVTEHETKAMMQRGSFRAFVQVGEEFHALQQANLAKGKGEGSYRGTVRFAGVQNKYFSILGFLPDDGRSAAESRVRLGGDRETGHQSWDLEVPARPGAGGASAAVSLYLGPNDYRRLRALGHDLEKIVNLGWKFIQPISELVLRLMNWLHGFIPNYGWVIVIISILSKLVFWPLTAKGTKAMKQMQDSQARLKPKLDALKKKHGGDPQRYNQEMMKLYKEEGVNPLAGMSGCMPMLVQMPVFIALYQVLYNMVDLRMAPWLGWINDLSQPDALFVLPFSLPLLGNLFNLLPLLMAAVTWWQTKLTPTSGAGGQMAAMNTIMPVMMLFFLYNMPSGLVIYWTINTAVTALQTWRIHKSAPASGGAPA
ncbi:MAG: membrane protein insertase YidC [bacterium]|nr:membrane protein insertase YidC [bacterium]